MILDLSLRPCGSRWAFSNAKTLDPSWAGVIAILDDPPTPMVKMGAVAGHREAGDGRELASRWIPLVLALPFSPSRQPTENHV